ncbi:MAG: hypothetical protein JNM97_22375 [Rhodoferax sp.]|nr:hypothetical protein [Rhodoferax sp.]
MADEIIPKDRLDLAWNAVAEAIALVGAIRREQQRDEAGETEFLLRTMHRRLDEVHSVALSVLGGDDAWKTEDMRKVLMGDAVEEVAHV